VILEGFFPPAPFTGCFKAMVSNGNFRKRFPVTAKIPLVTARTIGDAQGSPIPPAGRKSE
jgi:hypothetical protein